MDTADLPLAFISYRRDDSAPSARSIAEAVQDEFGIESVFMDTEKIRVGDDWPRRLENALATARALVVVIGPIWLKIADNYGRRRLDQLDDWVRNEILHAIHAGTTVIPVRVRGAQLPPSEALPEGLRPLLNSAAIELRDSHWKSDVEQLIDALRAIGFIRSHHARLHQSILRALGAGFLKTIAQLADLGPNAVRPKAAKVTRWLSLPDTPQNSERELTTAVTRTTDELRGTLKSEFDQIIVYLNEAESNPAIPQLIAATTLEMIRDDVGIVPQYLIQQMRIQEVHHDHFRHFLFILRRNLSLEQGYAEAIFYANELAGHGALKGFADQTAASLDHIARIKADLDLQSRAHRLTGDQKKALEDYNFHLREHQLTYSQLPLLNLKGGNQGPSKARIKDIFVQVMVGPKKNAEKQTRHSKHKPQMEETGGSSDRGESKHLSQPDDFVISPELGASILHDRKMVLLGLPGTGKTTLLKRAAMALAEAQTADLPGWGSTKNAIPIFLQLRGFAAYLDEHRATYFEPCPASIIGYLDHYYRELIRISLTPDFFDKLLAEGGCAVFMDSLDEVAFNQRDEVARHVAAFIVYYEQGKQVGGDANRDSISDNIFVLASRPKGYDTVEVSLHPAALAVRELKPLEAPGIRELLGKLLQFIENDDQRRAQDYQGLCDAILRARDLTILAGTPLYCAVLVLLYKYHGAELPARRVDVFEAIVDLMLGVWKAQDAQSGRLEEDDETGSKHVDLEAKVKKKKRWLSHIALQMQFREVRTEIDFISLVNILVAYLTERERIPPDQAATQAERFLYMSHERSNLLVETEPTDPPIYAFFHDKVREFLVADVLANYLDDKFKSAILDNIDNPTWEEIIVFAGAHRKLPDERRELLLDSCIEAARECKRSGNLEGWTRRLTMAGRMARDMGDYLDPNDQTKLKDVLAEAMLDTTSELNHRIEVALGLDHLGWLTDTLFVCVPIPFAERPQFYVGKHLVANQQYQRFLNAPDFGDLGLWENPHCIDCNGSSYSLHEESLRWRASNQEDKRLPRSWNDPKFGTAHRGLPIVGISWYEANAYCRWLMRHWRDLDEARASGGLWPKRIRLPTEQEWCHAVHGTQPFKRLPWEKSPLPASSQTEDLSAFANIGKVLDRTSPSGMFPKGTSYPFGLVDACGNAWEWQANFFDRSYRALALRGGAYTTSQDDITSDLRACREPMGRDNDVGLRILVEI